LRVASVDVGLKRVGVALLLNGIALPQEAILRKNRDQAAKELSNFLKEWQIDILVVGLPKGFSSQEEMERRIKHFISLIDFNKRVDYIDESFSSYEAKESFKSSKRDGKLDSLAAKIILERWVGDNKDVSI
jgi:putative Holliday junction resolvase